MFYIFLKCFANGPHTASMDFTPILKISIFIFLWLVTSVPRCRYGHLYSRIDILWTTHDFFIQERPLFVICLLSYHPWALSIWDQLMGTGIHRGLFVVMITMHPPFKWAVVDSFQKVLQKSHPLRERHKVNLWITRRL